MTNLDTHTYPLSAEKFSQVMTATNVREATHQDFFDSIIDWFYGGVEKNTLLKTFITIKSIQETKDNFTEILENFKILRGHCLPIMRDNFKIETSEITSGSFVCNLKIDDYIVRKLEIPAHETDLITACNKLHNVFEVDNFLMQAQGYKENSVSFMPLTSEISIKQGRAGDCYLLSALIGAFANKETISATEEMATIDDGNLVISFKIDKKLSIADNHINKIPLSNFIENADFIDQMKTKGYDISCNGSILAIKLSQQRITTITLNEMNAQTNAFITNFIEHFVGNFILCIDNTELGAEGYNILDNIDLNPPQLTRSPSIVAHSSEAINRRFNFTNLAANLLGHKSEKVLLSHNARGNKTIQKSKLEKLLIQLKASGKLIHSKTTSNNGFTHVGMDWMVPYFFGLSESYSSTHALIIGDIEFEKNQPEKINKVLLINPHDSSQIYPLDFDVFFHRNPTLQVFKKITPDDYLPKS